MRWSRVGFGSKSPASCSIANWSNGRLRVERPDHPVAVGPDLAIVVVVQAVACRRSAPRRASSAPGARRSAARPGGDRPPSRTRPAMCLQQTPTRLRDAEGAGQIQRQAPNERAPVGFGIRCEAGSFDLREHEPIDRRACPFPIGDQKAGPDARAPRMPSAASTRRLVQSSVSQRLFLPRRSGSCDSRAAASERAGIGFGDFLVEEALLGLTRHNRRAVAPRSEHVFVKVEPQVGLARRRVGTVAEEAVVRKDRADVALKIHARLRDASRPACRRARRLGPLRSAQGRPTAYFESTNLPIHQSTNGASEQQPSSKPNHALGLRKDIGDPAEVLVAEGAVRIGVMRDIERVEKVCADFSAPTATDADDLHDGRVEIDIRRPGQADRAARRCPTCSRAGAENTDGIEPEVGRADAAEHLRLCRWRRASGCCQVRAVRARDAVKSIGVPEIAENTPVTCQSPRILPVTPS